jgi:plastocyanin
MRAPIGAVVLAVALALAGARPQGQVQESGIIAGHVRLAGRVRGVPLPSNIYQGRSVDRRNDRAIPEVRNVVVYLKDVAYRGALPIGRHVVRQEGESFAPHILPVTRGSTVDFLNADPFFHNVFSLSSALTFDLGRYAQGKTRAPRPFGRPGLVKVYCHIHSHMSASILVLDHPYFTIPELDGSYTLQVPAGRYTLAAWHERAGERTTAIDVRPGAEVVMDLALPVDET